MGEKTASVGHFQIPTAPGALTAVAQSGSANTLGSAVSFGNAPSALYITGVTIGVATAQTPTYVQIQILVAAGIVASVLVPYGVSSAAAASVVTGYRAIYPPIPVANGAAITVKSASSVASAVAWGVSLECIAQANVVDDGVAQTSNVTQWNSAAVSAPATAGVPDVNVKNINNVVAATPGAAGGLQIAGANAATTYVTLTSTGAFSINGVSDVAQTGDSFAVVKSGGTGDNAAIKAKTDNLPASPASTTNITAAAGVALAANQHVIVDSGTVTTLTNLPAITAGWLTATGIAASALDNKGNWNVGKTGYSLTQTFPSNFASLAISAGGLASADIKSVNAVAVTGTGASGSRWGP